jgi:hypothetical protein
MDAIADRGTGRFFDGELACYPCLLLLFAGAVIAIISPERGIQDRLAGTWIVPR